MSVGAKGQSGVMARFASAVGGSTGWGSSACATSDCKPVDQRHSGGNCAEEKEGAASFSACSGTNTDSYGWERCDLLGVPLKGNAGRVATISQRLLERNPVNMGFSVSKTTRLVLRSSTHTNETGRMAVWQAK